MGTLRGVHRGGEQIPERDCKQASERSCPLGPTEESTEEACRSLKETASK